MVLVVALLFVLLFAHALMSRARGHDALAGEVSLVFGAVTGIFITGVTNVLFDTDRPPVFVEALASALILVVPLLTLRLVSRFRSLPSWLLPTAVVLYVAGSGTVVYLLAGLQPGADLPQWAAWFALAGFVATEAAATYYFWGEAGDRQGAARLRLRVAAMATALFAASMLSTQFSRPLVSQVLALVSAVGYVAAFMPPRRVLATSSMAAAHRYGRDLLTGPSQPTAEQVWKRFAVAVRELTESDAVVILSRTSNGETTTLTAAGIDLAGEQVRESVDFERLNKLSRQRRVNVQCPVESRLAARVDAEYATLIPLPPPYEGMSAHVAMLLSQHRSLFSGDDLAVIRDLGAQAALLSGRAESAYEQRRLANELGETVDALHVASRAKSDLLARVSHEFRTPLTAIIGYSALLRRSMEGGDPMLAQTGPDRIYSAGLHLLALVEEVLDVAQMDAGHLRLHIEDVELADLGARTIEELRPLASRKRLTLRSELPPGTLPVDAKRMHQVLYNLVSNAIRFTPAGGTVRVTAEMDEDKVRISVIDNGIGIPLDDQPRIFEEFAQVIEHGPHEGTGLGLAIVRRLVAAHGGHTELESAPGEGSRFIVTLPRRRAEEPTAGLSASEPGSGVGPQ